jgi:formylglycine-generating enzyme required for sulfatase activity
MKRRNFIKGGVALSAVAFSASASRYQLELSSPTSAELAVKALNAFGVDMLLINPGYFMWTENGKKITITRPFYLSRTPVTIYNYIEIMGGDSLNILPSNFKDLSLPADLGIKAKYVLYYLTNILNCPISIPTEAQWEYACRGGTQYKYYIGDSLDHAMQVAWFDKNSGNHLRPVGKLIPNSYGLYDMLGNIREQCIDYIIDFDRTTDPVGVTDVTGNLPVGLRGGGFFSSAQECTVHSRLSIDKIDYGKEILGARLCIHL